MPAVTGPWAGCKEALELEVGIEYCKCRVQMLYNIIYNIILQTLGICEYG